jgi:hypothetical protein
MAFEIVDDEKVQAGIDAAFAVLEEAVKVGHRFSNDQKDLGLRLSLDSLEPLVERPWFFEVAQMLKIPLWQTLWGQWRRNQENGMAQAPVLDPGWEGELTGEYGMEERGCDECGEVFKPSNPGARFCSNKCGAAVEKRERGIVDEPLIDELSKVTAEGMASEEHFAAPMPLFEFTIPPGASLSGIASPSAQLLPERFKSSDSEKPLDLGTDVVELPEE